MPSFIKAVTFDCAESLRTAAFWASALGSNVDEDSTSDRAFVEAAGWRGPNLWFIKVPEPKSAKNRVHFDLRAPGSVDDEVSRLVDLGAAGIRHGEDLVVMHDVEGNEFCVEYRINEADAIARSRDREIAQGMAVHERRTTQSEHVIWGTEARKMAHQPHCERIQTYAPATGT